MLPHVPVSADRFRGNIFKKISLLNTPNEFFQKRNHVFLYNLNFFNRLSSHQNNLILKNPQFILDKQKHKLFNKNLLSLSNIFYIKSKSIRLYKNTLKYKFQSLQNKNHFKSIKIKKSKRFSLRKIKNYTTHLLNVKLKLSKSIFRHKKLRSKSLRKRRKKLSHYIASHSFSK